MTDTTTPPAAEDRLVFCDHVLVHVPNGGYQWVDVKTFTLIEDVDDRTVLGLLIGHVRYRHSYATPTFYDAKVIHGPYWLEAISVGSFSAVSAASAEALITTWANYDAPIPDGEDAELTQRVYGPLRRATAIYQLADLRATAEHDWGSVVGFTGFHEFVVIDHATCGVRLIVASDD